MIVIPCLEVAGGRVVRRAVDGSAGEVLAEDPFETARELMSHGAVFFQIVDLDAEAGNGNNRALIEQFAGSMVPCQYSGAVNSFADVEEVVRLGADRVILGSWFAEQPELAREIVERYGMRIVASFELDGPNAMSIDAAAEALKASGVSQAICTQTTVSAVEAMTRLREIMSRVDVHIYADAPIQGREDLNELRPLTDEGLAGCVVRSAVGLLLPGTA